MRYPCLFVLNCLITLAMTCQLFGESIILHPVADTSLFEAAPDNNLGSSLSLVSGGNGSGYRARELLRFDAAGSLPASAIVQSVTLTMTVVNAPAGGGTSSTFDLHRLLVDWQEGRGTGNSGSPALEGETTWNNQFYPTTSWSSPGGAVSNEYSAIVSASLPLDGIGSYTFNSTSNLVSDVQSWLTNPSTNFGWVIISESESVPFTARRFGSREDANNAPALTVQYALAAPPIIQTVEMINNQLHLGFLAHSGYSYIVLYRNSLTEGTWSSLTNIPAQALTTNVTVFDPAPTSPQRFYRITIPL